MVPYRNLHGRYQRLPSLPATGTYVDPQDDRNGEQRSSADRIHRKPESIRGVGA